MKSLSTSSLSALAVTAVMAALCSCSPSKDGNNATQLTQSGLDPAKFETTVNNKPVALYTLRNKGGMEVCITNFGGRIVSADVPDKDGTFRDVVLGFDSIADYLNIASDFGASIGRYANRISGAQFVLNGDTVKLPANDKTNCLHGGPRGWQYQVYDAEQTGDSLLVLTMQSPDGDMGFPGNMTATVTYRLTADNAIDISYSATTDKPTVVNMTNHSYFNLSGDPATGNAQHILYINADTYTPVDTLFIPTGEIATVKGTPMDFTTPKPVGQDINADFEQLHNGNGYDHNWILNTAGDITKLAARLTCPDTGISLELYTDEPGVQMYAGNFLDGTVSGKHGTKYPKRASVCLETQHFPDSPNKPQFPTVTLNPGETYHSHCIFKFTTTAPAEEGQQ